MRKTVMIIAGALLALPVLFVGGGAVAAASQGYGWEQMDWNGDGRTSAGEFLAAADVGKRELCKDGKNCVEFYALKDGRTLRTDCK